MSVTIGIRREDKNEWERRVPLTPCDAARLQRVHGLKFLVQPSPIRTFLDQEYRSAGLAVSEGFGSSGDRSWPSRKSRFTSSSGERPT